MNWSLLGDWFFVVSDRKQKPTPASERVQDVEVISTSLWLLLTDHFFDVDTGLTALLWDPSVLP